MRIYLVEYYLDTNKTKFLDFNLKNQGGIFFVEHIKLLYQYVRFEYYINALFYKMVKKVCSLYLW